MTDEPEAFLKLESVGELIATRTLTLRQENGATSEIMVLLGKPQQLPKHEDYYCPYQIKGAGDEKVRYTCGVDSFQALHLACQDSPVAKFNRRKNVFPPTNAVTR